MSGVRGPSDGWDKLESRMKALERKVRILGTTYQTHASEHGSGGLDSLAGLFPEGGIEIVSALPTLPDAAYPEDKFVFLNTVDGSNGVGLYRNEADVWTDDGILDKLSVSRLTAGTLNAAVVLASTFITAASGARVEIDGPNNRIRIYDADEVLVFDAGALGLTVRGTLTNQGSGVEHLQMSPDKALTLEALDSGEGDQPGHIRWAGKTLNLSPIFDTGESVPEIHLNGTFPTAVAIQASTHSFTIVSPTGSGAYLQLTEMTAPATPSSNRLRIYAKDKAGVSTLYYKKDDGTEVEVASVSDVAAKALITGFGRSDVPASLTADRLYRVFAAALTGRQAGVTMDRPGSIVGISVHAEGARTAGTATRRWCALPGRHVAVPPQPGARRPLPRHRRL